MPCIPEDTTKKYSSAPSVCWAIDGDDRCPRKANLQRLLARRPDGVFISQFE